MDDQYTSKQKQQAAFIEILIKSLYQLVQTLKIHEKNNPLVIQSAETLTKYISQISETGEWLSFQSIRGKLFFQQEKIHYRRESRNIFEKMAGYLEHRNIQELRFHNKTALATVDEIILFGQLLNLALHHKTKENWLSERLKASGLKWAKAVRKEENTENHDPDAVERGKKIYAFALSSIKEIGQKISDQQRVGIVKPLRMAQKMVDFMSEDEDIFKTLSLVQIHDDYTFCHSVNVAILSMLIGKRIGLSKKALERIALSGMLHDLGKIEVPHFILNKPGKLTDDEFEEMKRHSLNGVRLIVQMNVSRDRKARLLLPPYEHHLKYDLSGYPQPHRRKSLTLFGRILAIADVYDAVTSPRAYRKSTLSPDRALGLMLKSAGKDFDPIILKVFINIMGVYPIGTLLKLHPGGKLGLVSRASGSSGAVRPRVMLLNPDGSGGWRQAGLIDLKTRNPQTGKYRWHIAETLHPSDYNIRATDFLI